jgi:hypothetical protein
LSNLYAMRRANGDWFALDEKGQLRMPVFQTSGAAQVARSRDSTMECFRPAVFDSEALERIKITDGDAASFLIVSNPELNLKRGRPLGFAELALLIVETERKIAE